MIRRSAPKVRPTPRPKIDLEAIFDIQIRAVKLPPAKRQHKFHQTRKWVFDFAWPEQKIAVEIDGGTYIGGRHVRPEGYRNDCIKVNSALLLGWRVFRGDVKMVKDGTLLQFAERAIQQSKGE